MSFVNIMVSTILHVFVGKRNSIYAFKMRKDLFLHLFYKCGFYKALIEAYEREERLAAEFRFNADTCKRVLLASFERGKP